MDMWARSIQRGNLWYGVFKTPGRGKRLVCKDGQPVSFDNKADAIQAAADTLCQIFRDTTTGWRDAKISPARKKAEAAFRRVAGA